MAPKPLVIGPCLSHCAVRRGGAIADRVCYHVRPNRFGWGYVHLLALHLCSDLLHMLIDLTNERNLFRAGGSATRSAGGWQAELLTRRRVCAIIPRQASPTNTARACAPQDVRRVPLPCKKYPPHCLRGRFLEQYCEPVSSQQARQQATLITIIAYVKIVAAGNSLLSCGTQGLSSGGNRSRAARS